MGVEGGGGRATRGVHISVFLISVQTNSAACYQSEYKVSIQTERSHSITEHKSPPQSKKKKRKKKIQTNLQLSMTDGNNAKWGKENEQELVHVAFWLKIILGCWKKQWLLATNKNDCFWWVFFPTTNSLEVKITWLANLDPRGFKGFQLLSLLIKYEGWHSARKTALETWPNWQFIKINGVFFSKNYFKHWRVRAAQPYNCNWNNIYFKPIGGVHVADTSSANTSYKLRHHRASLRSPARRKLFHQQVLCFPRIKRGY